MNRGDMTYTAAPEGQHRVFVFSAGIHTSCKIIAAERNPLQGNGQKLKRPQPGEGKTQNRFLCTLIQEIINNCCSYCAEDFVLQVSNLPKQCQDLWVWIFFFFSFTVCG